MFCVNIFFLWGRVGKKGGEGWPGEGYVSVCVLLGGSANEHDCRATHQENHNCLRNNVHDDYTVS